MHDHLVGVPSKVMKLVVEPRRRDVVDGHMVDLEPQDVLVRAEFDQRQSHGRHRQAERALSGPLQAVEQVATGPGQPLHRNGCASISCTAAFP